MRRLFVEHQIRQVMSLDGLWKLVPHNGTDKEYAIMVPGVWERIPELAAFRGTADFERTVKLDAAGSYLLRIGAVSHTGTVYWDGVEVGRHYNAFTGFDILLEDVAAGTHHLRVLVDNRFSEASALHIPNDYYTYGGINRGMELQKLGRAYITNMAFHSVKQADGSYQAVVKVTCKALADIAAELVVSVAGAAAHQSIDLKRHEEQAFSFTVNVGNVTEWDVLNAHLYDLRATVVADGRPEDDLTDRVGFRTVQISGEDILLNGKKLLLRGFNRHEDHGLFGCALPVQAMMDDLQLILDMGANTIRTCHYPNDPRFLDLCDELGILVWEEHHARALPMSILETELFAEQEAAVNIEMVAQHVNHPCIYIWGVLNECESATEAGRAIYESQINHLRRLDPTRPISFASCRFFADICMDLVDVVSWNIYPRWYVDESVQSYSDRLITWMEEHGAAGKPILITEVGAGGIAGYHDAFAMSKWSEERQREILSEQLTVLLNNKRLSGVYVWQFADTHVAEEWSMHRPKTQNNKGVVDMFRNPKLSYFTVKELFRCK